MAVTAAGAHLLLGIDWQLALLLGAIVSSTDAAAVFSVLRVVPLAPPGGRPARGRVRIQRRPGRHPRADVQRRRRWRFRPVHAVAELVYELAVGCRDRVGLRTSRAQSRCAASPCPRPGSIRSRRSGSAWSRSPRRAARTPAGSSPPTWPRWCSPTPGCRTGRPPGRSRRDSAGWRRSACSSCSACWSTPAIWRAELVPAIVIGLVLLLVARPLSVFVLACRIPGALARAGLPVLGRSARRGADRAGDLPDRRGCHRQHPPAQHRVHPRRGVHAGSGPQPAPARAPVGADPEARPPARSRSKRHPSTCWRPSC